MWKPSPGSVYPASSSSRTRAWSGRRDRGRRARTTLTAEGRAYVANNREELGNPSRPPRAAWTRASYDLRGLMFQVGAAAMQVAAAGHADEARRIFAETRRSLHKILAEDEPIQEAEPLPHSRSQFPRPGGRQPAAARDRGIGPAPASARRR